MSTNSRKFNNQFKAESVQLVLKSGRPIAQVAKELEVNKGTLGNWVAKWRAGNPEPEKAPLCEGWLWTRT